MLGTAKNITLLPSGGKWFASIQTEREVEQPVPRGNAIGIDVGIARFATLSDGSFIAPPFGSRRRGLGWEIGGRGGGKLDRDAQTDSTRTRVEAHRGTAASGGALHDRKPESGTGVILASDPEEPLEYGGTECRSNAGAAIDGSSSAANRHPMQRGAGSLLWRRRLP